MADSLDRIADFVCISPTMPIRTIAPPSPVNEAIRSQIRDLAMDFLVPPDSLAAYQARERRRDQLLGLIALRLLEIEDAISEGR